MGVLIVRLKSNPICKRLSILTMTTSKSISLETLAELAVHPFPASAAKHIVSAGLPSPGQKIAHATDVCTIAGNGCPTLLFDAARCLSTGIFRPKFHHLAKERESERESLKKSAEHAPQQADVAVPTGLCAVACGSTILAPGQNVAANLLVEPSPVREVPGHAWPKQPMTRTASPRMGRPAFAVWVGPGSLTSDV